MLKDIKKIQIDHHNVKEIDLEKIIFPVQVDELSDVRIINGVNNKVLTFNDYEFAFAMNVKAQKGDVILITFKKSDLEIILQIEDIDKYTTSFNRYIYANGFKGTRIDIMDRSYNISKDYPSKIMINLYEDLMTIYADKVTIKDIMYIK